MKTGKINRVPEESGLSLPLADLLWLRSEWLQQIRVAEDTRTSYGQKTKHFVGWWTQYGQSVDWCLTQRHLLKFEEHLLTVAASGRGGPLAWHTRHNILRRTAELLGWAYRNGYIEDVNPRGWMPPASGEPPERIAPTIDHLRRLITATERSRYPMRDRTILALFIGTGIRLGEMAGLRAENITLCADGSGTAAIVGKRTRANRGGRRTVAFDAHTGCYLIAYLDAMLITEGPLFLSDQSGAALGGNSIYKMVKRTIRLAGLEKHVQGCHDLRRAFSTILALSDLEDPLFADMIRRQLGHKHYSQTAEYTKIDADHIRQRIVSPLALDGK